MTVPRRRLRAALAVTLLASAAAFLAPTTGPIGSDLPGADKVAHVVIFALLAGLAGASWPHARTRAAILLLGYAALTEGLQALVPGRTPDAWDLLANLAGIAIGLGIHVACEKRRRFEAT